MLPKRASHCGFYRNILVLASDVVASHLASVVELRGNRFPDSVEKRLAVLKFCVEMTACYTHWPRGKKALSMHQVRGRIRIVPHGHVTPWPLRPFQETIRVAGVAGSRPD